MIDITTHTNEVIKAEIPTILKILLFVAIFIFSRVGNKKKKEGKKVTKPQREEDEVFDRIRNSANHSIEQNRFQEDEEEFYDRYTETEEAEFNPQEAFVEMKKEMPQKPIQTFEQKKASIQGSKWEKITTETTPKKEQNNMQIKSKVDKTKKKIKFDLKQAIIAEAVLNRKYS
ncbi:hypothetical protein OAT16_07650 [Prolixibacteraceae bacterium]|nr:hypothetical protein [Prolixibacteraceae bacterium]